jgi:hypothetical protein
MANTTYEQVPLDGPTSPKLPQAAAEPETPITPVTPNFEKKSLLSKLSYGFPTRSPDSPETPKTPATLSFERKGLLKRLTGGYQPTKEELEADPLERLQRQDTVCAILTSNSERILRKPSSISRNVFARSRSTPASLQHVCPSQFWFR